MLSGNVSSEDKLIFFYTNSAECQADILHRNSPCGREITVKNTVTSPQLFLAILRLRHNFNCSYAQTSTAVKR